MQRQQLQIVLIAVHIFLCTASSGSARASKVLFDARSIQDFDPQRSNRNESVDIVMGESVVSTDLKLKPKLIVESRHKQSDQSPTTSEGEEKHIKSVGNDPLNEIGKSKQPTQYYENDYSFIVDKLDETMDDDEDFDELADSSSPQSQFLAKANLPTNPVKIGATNPIYITVPIYINTARERPMVLSVGGQQIPLNMEAVGMEKQSKDGSPTSTFNRLLRNNNENLINTANGSAKKRSVPSRHNHGHGNGHGHRHRFQAQNSFRRKTHIPRKI